jgi:hypothetical protein
MNTFLQNSLIRNLSAIYEMKDKEIFVNNEHYEKVQDDLIIIQDFFDVEEKTAAVIAVLICEQISGQKFNVYKTMHNLGFEPLDYIVTNGVLKEFKNNGWLITSDLVFSKRKANKEVFSKEVINAVINNDKALLEIKIPDNIIEAIKAIEGQNFDIIVYCELGMLMKPLYLSYARLAPLQITTWGHSETSGIDTIDYYVSSKLFDVEEDLAKEHYSEKLYLMDSLSTYYYPPTKILLPSDHVYKSRKDYKLDDNMNIYGCIQSSFKISDDFEKILYGILKADPNARILMSYSKPYCRSQIQRII